MEFFLDEISKRAAENPFAPALISPLGSIAYDEFTDTVVKVSNVFDDRRLPRGGRAYLNIREPELRLAVTLAALTYGLVPCLAAPETLKRHYELDFTIGARVPLRQDVPADVMVDHAALAGKLADGQRRSFPERADDDVAMVTETTGTTGYPKLLATTRKALHASLENTDRRRFEPGDRLVMAFGGISRYAFTASVTALFDGAALVSVPVDAIGTLKMIALFEVTDLLTTPLAIREMVEAMEQHHLKAPSMKRINLTGSLVSPELLKRVQSNFAARIRIGYGTSEVSGITGAIVTSATFQRGYVGEVRAGVTLVSAGTRDEPAPVIIANDPTHRTQYIVGGEIVTDDRPTVTLPDLGFLEGTALYLVGRADEVYNFSGNKLPYDAVQREIERQAPVTDIGIVGGGAIGRDDDLIVAIAADQPLDLTGLRERVLSALGWTRAAAHVHFFQVPGVPRNAMGKVDRGGVLRLYLERAALPAS